MSLTFSRSLLLPSTGKDTRLAAASLHQIRSGLQAHEVGQAEASSPRQAPNISQHKLQKPVAVAWGEP